MRREVPPAQYKPNIKPVGEGIKGEVQKIQLRPGDRLVVKMDSLLTLKTLDDITRQITNWAGDIPVLVLDARAELFVVSGQEG